MRNPTQGLASLLLVAIVLGPVPVLADTVETLVMPGKVIEGHSDVEGQCRKCHQPFKKEAQNALCLACHKDVAQDIGTKTGHHGRFADKACRECHTDHKGRTARIIDLDEKRFDHTLSDFLLRGKHANAKCADCHPATKKFRDAPHTCNACHRKDDVHREKLGTDCAKCHVESGWKKIEFDHQKTRFPLTGRHVPPKCSACHRDQIFKNTPRDCVACHRKDDTHRGSLGDDCGKCHNDRGWKDSLFDHARTQFPLLGAHGKVRCLACHRNQAFNDKPPLMCASCHQKQDVHKGRFGDKCGTCHDEMSWKTIRFDHDRDTDFKLREAHRAVKCETCHTGKLYVDDLPKDCNGCHAKKDVHRGSLGTRCETCHLQNKWKPTTFDHDRDSRYPLRGRHAQITCKACHLDGTFRDKLPTQCLACHRKDDRHAGQEGPDCERCHVETSWKTTDFDHGRSAFPLIGRHLNVACGKCHASPRFKDARKECMACHRKDDVHKRRLGGDCESCHNARDWRIWDFDHDKRTRFGLDGAHRKVECTDCHTQAGEKLPKVGTRCIDCHERDDVHRDAFGTRCERCHSTVSFKDIRR